MLTSIQQKKGGNRIRKKYETVHKAMLDSLTKKKMSYSNIVQAKYLRHGTINILVNHCIHLSILAKIYAKVSTKEMENINHPKVSLCSEINDDELCIWRYRYFVYIHE